MKNPIAIILFLLLRGVAAFFRSTTCTTKCSKGQIPNDLQHRGGGAVARARRKNPQLSELETTRIYTDKPLLRGEFHRIGALCYPLLLGLPLYLRAKPNHKLESLMFSLAVEGIMVVSATLHTFPWQRRHEDWYMIARKADFAMIFIGIALFYSSIGRLLLGSTSIFTNIIEPLVWICAAIGVIAKCFFPDAPPWFNAAIFLIQGWACGPLVPLLFRTASMPEAIGLFLGGICITLGATAYSVRWPNGHWHFHPDIFGPHEMFHIGTLFMFGSFWFTMWMRVAR